MFIIQNLQKKKSLFRFSQKFLIRSHIFIHIQVVPIIYERLKVQPEPKMVAFKIGIGQMKKRTKNWLSYQMDLQLQLLFHLFQPTMLTNLSFFFFQTRLRSQNLLIQLQLQLQLWLWLWLWFHLQLQSTLPIACVACERTRF